MSDDTRTPLDAATLRAVEDAWWAGRRSTLAQRGEATGPLVQAMCNNDLMPILSRLADAAAPRPVETHTCQSWPGGWTCHICGKHYTIAAPVGEQEKDMPPIEVGDWVQRWGGTPGLSLVITEDRVNHYNNTWVKGEILEIRKADGRVWRRNG